MNIAVMLTQLRTGIKTAIDMNPVDIVMMRKEMVSDGMGGLVENPYGTPVAYPVHGRISKERRGPEGGTPINTGLSTAGSFYLLVEHTVTIYKNDPFEWNDRRWRLDAVSEIVQAGGVIAYEAPLIQAEEEPTT